MSTSDEERELYVDDFVDIDGLPREGKSSLSSIKSSIVSFLFENQSHKDSDAILNKVNMAEEEPSSNSFLIYYKKGDRIQSSTLMTCCNCSNQKISIPRVNEGFSYISPLFGLSQKSRINEASILFRERVGNHDFFGEKIAIPQFLVSDEGLIDNMEEKRAAKKSEEYYGPEAIYMLR